MALPIKDELEVVKENENIEIELLLNAIFMKFGYDFRNYGKAHISSAVCFTGRLFRALAAFPK